MDSKIKLLAVASVVTVLMAGCSNNRGYGGGSTGGNVDYAAGSGSRGGLFSQNRPAPVNTCSACAASNNSQGNYTYTPPAPKAPAKPVAKPAGKYDQQYYVDKWKREQAQAGANTNYAGYGDGSNAQYYDYTSGGANNSTSNKSIYTGSYQQKTYKPYKPTTYVGGSAATNTGDASTYTVKKGDTVFEIMRQTGVYWKDIIKMNNLVAPAYNINPGQKIRLK